jgi:hypothetical protein
MRPSSTTRQFTVYADYHQFYVEDAESDLIASAAPDFWSAEAFEVGLAVAEEFFAVGTARYGDVKVEVEVADSAPDDSSRRGIRLTSAQFA